MNKWYVVQHGTWQTATILGPYETEKDGDQCLAAIRAMHPDSQWWLYSWLAIKDGTYSRLRLNESGEVVDLPTQI